MKILYIAWGFPPMGGNGIQRTLKFVKYLPANDVEVTVLASSDSKQGNLKDEKLIAEIPDSVRVYRVSGAGWLSGIMKMRDTAKKTARALPDKGRGTAGFKEVFVGWVLRNLAAPAWRFLLNTAMLPDLARPWANNAIRALPRILSEQEIDAVYVTGPPFSAFLVAERAATLAGVPLLMEYRDPWCIPSGRPTHWLKHRIERRWEARIIKSARKVIFDNPVSRDAHVAFYGIPFGKTAIIPNGYDPADRVKVSPLTADGILFGYSGSFTSDGRTPRYFIDALRAVLDRHPEWAGKLRAKFVGQFWPDDKVYIESKRLQECIETTGFLSHAESIRHVAGFDVALVIGETCKGNTNTVPEKIYEYMMWEKPILALVPEDGASARLIKEYGLGEVTGVDKVPVIMEKIEKMIQMALAGKSLTERGPGTERFDRKRLAGELGEIIREAVYEGALHANPARSR